MDTSVLPVAVKATDDAGLVCELAPARIDGEALSTARTTLALPLAPLTPYQRFVVFHQFLI